MAFLYLDIWFYVRAQPPLVEALTPLEEQGLEQSPLPYFPDLPFQSIVQTKGIYTYETMLKHLQALAVSHELLTIDVIGQSVEKRAIYLIKLGHGSKKILLDGAHHGNEWIASFLLMSILEHYSYHYHTGYHFQGYDLRDLLSQYSLYFVPMVNPDGVEIVASNGRSSADYKQLLALNGGSTNFAGWKANARGVDLNRQYPTNWTLAQDYGPSQPAPANYAGSGPLTEPEVVVMEQLQQEEEFDAYLTYHSVGNEVFYYYYQTGSRLERDRTLAHAVGRLTNYRVRHSSGGIGGMARDHNVTARRVPTLIMELGVNKHKPLPEFADMWKRNREVPCLVMDWLLKWES